MHLRPVAALLGQLMAGDGRPLTAAREPAARLAGNCRHFTVLAVAMLRAQGTPARARCGFGGYFGTGVVCSVTGSTQAGMVAGFAALAGSGGRPRRIVGIDASARPAETRDQITGIARQTARLIGVEREVGDGEIELDERYHAGTYGIPDDATFDAMRLAARTEGMITDPVYEGKSMAGLIDLISGRETGPASTVLYAHLGGQPALNAYSALFS